MLNYYHALHTVKLRCFQLKNCYIYIELVPKAVIQPVPLHSSLNAIYIIINLYEHMVLLPLSTTLKIHC